MYSGIFGVVIGLVISLFISQYEDIVDKVIIAFLCAVVGFFIGLLILGTILGEMAPRVSQQTGSFEIVNMHTGEGVQGSYFLGTGTINGYPMYSYFRQQTDGGYVQETIPAGSTVVYEDMTEQQGKIDIYDSVIPDSWKNWVVTAVQPSTYRAYIPKGSIMRNFELR